jgi:hypothetical protein
MEMQINLSITSPEIADAILALANAVSQMQITSETHERSSEMNKTIKTEAAPMDKTKPHSQDQPNQPSSISLETLRTKLIDLSRNGKQPQIKALINSFGVKKLTDIPESKYEEILVEVEKW